MVADPEQEVRSLAKKVLWILFAVVLVLALAVAGVTGYFWYQNNHIFVEDAVYPINAKTLDLRGQDISFEHYDAVHSQLPNCEIYWDVPFQVGKYPNDTTKLTVADLTEKDIRILLNYFPKLKTLDATACSDYAVLESAKQQLPGCEILYEVNLGGKSFAPEVTELTLEVGDYDYDTLMENLQYLPGVQHITLKKPELSLEQIDELKTTFGNITIDCTVDIGGTEYTMDTTELNLSGISSGDVAGVSEKLGMLSGLTSVELMKSDGTTGLTKEDVKTLKEAAPAASFHYVFDFYGETLSTTETTEVHIKNVNIGEEGLPEARLALDLMENCSRFVLENCKISNESMAQLREDYRGKTKVVWRVPYGGGNCMTDCEVIRCTYELTDKNAQNLVYCEDVRFMDVGHNDVTFLSDFSFLKGMPKLEAIIISSAYVSDLTPFANCKELKFFEAAFCGNIEDLSPLAQCEKLEMVNISFTKVKDLSPLDNLPIKTLFAQNYSAKRISAEEQSRFASVHPDCLTQYTGDQPYGRGWRYDEHDKYLPYYGMLRKVFRLDDDIIPNSVGWYLREGDTDLPTAES